MTDTDKIVQRQAWLAYESWRAWPNREAYTHQAIAQAAANTAVAIEARVRAEVAEEIANAIDMNVRNPDFDKQDRGGWPDFPSKMAYVAGHDNAAKIARSIAAGSSPDTTPEPKP